MQSLLEIELHAGEVFRTLDMDAVADDEPFPTQLLAQYQEAGRAWVAQDADEIVGYLLLDVVAGAAHIEQVSVDPGHARRRVGSQLIEVAAAWARNQGLQTMTLTSFALVPWNAPYYARLGFVVISAAEQPPELREIRRIEAERGLDTWPRVAMRRQLN
jgi:GNAT superfamily N-acetyltransferase